MNATMKQPEKLKFDLSQSYVAKTDGQRLTIRKYIYIFGFASLFASAPAWAGMGAWTTVASPAFNGTNVSVNKLARNPTNGAIRYAATQNGMYKSSDGGLSWQAVNTGIAPSPAGYVGVGDIAIDPQNTGNIYITPYFLQKSVDGGNTWGRTGWVTENPQASVLAIDPKTPTTVYAGANRGIYKSTDGASTWNYMVASSYTSALAIDPNNPANLYMRNSNGMYKSTNGGATWNQINSTLSVNTITVDPKNSANIYVGTFGSGVYKSSDGGATWNAANQCYPVSGNTISLNNANVHAFAFDSSNTSILYLGADDGIYKSVDGGAHWTQANNGPMPGASTLMLDPNDPATVIAGNGYGIYSYTFPTTSTTSQTIGTISFSPTSLTVGGTSTVSATATSGLPVSFSSTTPTICTVSGSTVTGVAAGTCTIAANQAGSTSYSATAQVTQSIQVAAAGGTPVVTSVSSISTNQVQTITITGSGFGTMAPYSGDSSYIVLKDVTTSWYAGNSGNGSEGHGTNYVTLSISSWSDSQIVISGFGNYYNSNGWVFKSGDNINIKVWNAQSGAGPGSYNTTVGGNVQTQTQTVGTITFSPTTIAVRGTATLTATATSGLEVTFTSLTPTICTVTTSNASLFSPNTYNVTGIAGGACTIAANQAGNSSYSAAAQVTQSIQVTQSVSTSQTIGTINFSPTTIAVGGTGVVSAAATSSLEVVFTSLTPNICNVSVSKSSLFGPDVYTVTGVASGACTIAANQAGGGSLLGGTYSAAPQTTQNITIGISQSDCIFNWAERIYPQYFSPAGAVSQTNVPPYYYRYYSGTGNYLATSSADNNVWVLGPVSGNIVEKVGPVTSFLGSVSGCQ